jgi:hypothetical protein
VRAVVLGLMGVLLVGASEAKECKPDGIGLSDERAEPRFQGTFKVVRVASYFRHWDKPLPRRWTTDGWMYYVLEHRGQKYFVKQIYDLRTIPEEYGESHVLNSAEAKKAPWGQRNWTAEKARYMPILEIQMGPLKGLTLKPDGCTFH